MGLEGFTSVRYPSERPDPALMERWRHKCLPKAAGYSLLQILVNATVFARMSPGQKSSLIEEFQKLK